MGTNQKVMFAAYVGRGKHLTAKQIAEKAGVSIEETLAELSDLIAVQKIVQLASSSGYVFAHKASVRR